MGETNRSISIVEELKKFRWIDEFTKHVEVDFTIFNINLDMFAAVGLEVEYDLAGISKPTFLIQALMLDVYEWVSFSISLPAFARTSSVFFRSLSKLKFGSFSKPSTSA